MSKTVSVVEKRQTISLQNPSEVMRFSNQLKEIIVKNKLFTNVKGKNYVNVEGWQIAGAFTGIEPIVEKIENLSEGDTIRYRAEVALYDTKREGAKCGMGMAICTNKEAGKKQFEEYAIASMAQTRAIGKAFRLKLGWLMKLAGYEPTPAEEIAEAEVVGKATNNSGETERDLAKEVESAIKALEVAQTATDLCSVWLHLPKEVRVSKEVIKKKDELKTKFAVEDAAIDIIKEKEMAK